ncbi:hypothetical protein F2Q69_00035617 [Brassica cretica]|uniref:Uncharacterized protein n=1 Tax=Brassica cretica TaxID=69181 RepID=A0A8S9SLW2_BRACR|nr:hypothetical protein F2Q69_00035617 [Brassica cretica]
MTQNGGKHEMGSLRSLRDSIKGWKRVHGLMSYRRFGRARSLRSDRAWLELGRYVATEPCACSVAMCNRFVALPFSAINLVALAIGAVAAGVFLPALLQTAIFSFVFLDIVLIKHFAAMS